MTPAKLPLTPVEWETLRRLASTARQLRGHAKLMRLLGFPHAARVAQSEARKLESRIRAAA